MTHAEFPSQNLTAEEQVELADHGRDHRALLHHHAHRQSVLGRRVMLSIRRRGPERCILSTDLGQTINPPVAEGFAMFAQKLMDGGFSLRAEVRRMAVTNPARWSQ